MHQGQQQQQQQGIEHRKTDDKRLTTEIMENVSNNESMVYIQKTDHIAIIQLPGDEERFLFTIKDDYNRSGNLIDILELITVDFDGISLKMLTNSLEEDKARCEFFLKDSSIKHECVDFKTVNRSEFSNMLTYGNNSIILAECSSAYEESIQDLMVGLTDIEEVTENSEDVLVKTKLSGENRFLFTFKTEISISSTIDVLRQCDKNMPITIYAGTHEKKDGRNWKRESFNRSERRHELLDEHVWKCHSKIDDLLRGTGLRCVFLGDDYNR